MAISTFKTFLMKGSGSTSITYAKLVDIVNFGDIGGDPEPIEITTLSDGMRRFMPGIKSSDVIPCIANYDKTDYSTLKALEGTEQDLAFWFGGTASTDGTITPTGSDGKFTFKGYISVKVNGGDINTAVRMTISVIPSSIIAAS